MEKLQYTQHIAPLRRAGIELAITISAGPTLPETIIGFGIYNAFFIHGSQVAAAVAHILAPFYYYRLNT